MPSEKIDIINNWTLQKVFTELENGNMKIPRFQRGYVWERAKIVNLLNSIYAEHPIGTFFIWEASAEYSNYCRNMDELHLPQEPEAGKIHFIIDGQQRITSLYVALTGKKLGTIDYSTICFNLDKKCFLIPRLKTEPNNIPVWKIFNTSEQNKLLIDYVPKGGEYATTIISCKHILDSYPICIIKTLNVDLEEAVTIFENINQGGKRLTLFDLVHASVWSQDFDLRQLVEIFNESDEIKRFGCLSEETFTQSLSLNAKNNCQKINQLHLTNSECKKFWPRTMECLRLAIDFVKNLGAVRSDILPYEAMLPVLQYYYFVYGKSSMENAHRQMITDWFWSTTFSKRYSSSTLSRQKEDADWIASIIAGNQTSRIFAITTNIKELFGIQMKQRSVVKNGVLCIFAANNPVDFNNGQFVTIDKTNASRANAKENHHFFPFSRQRDFNISSKDVNSLLNFAFISKSLNGEILNKLPSQYIAQYMDQSPDVAKWLLSHFIDDKALNAARRDNFTDFVEARGTLLMESINERCRVTAQSELIVNESTDDESNYDETENDEINAGFANSTAIVQESQIEQGRNAPSKISVVFSDGTTICERLVSDSFVRFIQKVGIERILDLGLTHDKQPLIIRNGEKFEYPAQGRDLGCGFMVNVHSSTSMKCKQIENIANKLGISINVVLKDRNE